jgi:sirohydrochlorin cobaltochelatase
MSGRGLLLFAHGARDPQWALPFEAVVAKVRARQPELPVELAFLEFMAPTLAAASQRLAAAGCSQVSVVPLFLGAGGHVRKDLPELLAELARQHPQVSWTLTAAIGEVDSVVQAMADAALDLGASSPPRPAL